MVTVKIILFDKTIKKILGLEMVYTVWLEMLMLFQKVYKITK